MDKGMINRVVLVGRLTRDPELRTTGSGISVATFTLAVDRQFTNSQGERGADFISCVAFGKNGEFAEKYLHKGTKIAVEGRIQTGSYTNKDGVKVYTTDVVVESQEFAESKNAQSGNGGSEGGYANSQQPQADADGFMNIPDGIEELPFT